MFGCFLTVRWLLMLLSASARLMQGTMSFCAPDGAHMDFTGDVITALGNKDATHIPYRNSKLVC